MIRRMVGAAALAVLGCTPRPPDVVTPSGVSIWWDGQPADPRAVPTIEDIYLRAGAVCPVRHTPELERKWRTLEVHWSRDRFDCGGRLVHGCQPGPAYVIVSSPFALGDEIGHMVWETCFGRSGEYVNAQGLTVYEPAFADWLGTIHVAPWPIAVDVGAALTGGGG